MSDPLKRVTKGERVTRTAATHNALVEAARASRESRFGLGRGEIPTAPAASIVKVKNLSGAPVRRHGVLALNGVVITPNQNEAAFLADPCFSGVVPTASTTHFVILQEPLAPDAIGRGVVSGFTPAVLRVTAEANSNGYTYADRDLTVGAAGTTALALAQIGQAEVVWRQSGTGLRRGYVLVSNTPPTTLLFGVIRTAPNEGVTVSPTHDVDVYGTTLDSVDGSPSQTLVEATNPLPDFYYRGELVMLSQTESGDLSLLKLLRQPFAYTVSANQIAVRLFRAPNTEELTPTLSSMLVDVVDCWGHFDEGNNTDDGFMVFAYGGYGGYGQIGVNLSVPVRHKPGTYALVTFVSVHTTATQARDLVALDVDVGPATAASSQDTLSGFTQFDDGNIFARWTLTTIVYSPGEYVVFDPDLGVERDVGEVRGFVTMNFAGVMGGGGPLADDVTNVFTNAPALPVIEGANNSTIILCGYWFATIFPTEFSATALPPNKTYPQISAYKAIATGGETSAGTYDLNVTSLALGGVIVVT